MRTTVTFDADTEALIRNEIARSGLSFKEVLNRAVRCALGRRTGRLEVTPVFPAAFPASLKDRSFNQLAAEWEDEDTLRELSS